jgi:uncharacterized protein YcbK (DUF882 family)
MLGVFVGLSGQQTPVQARGLENYPGGSSVNVKRKAAKRNAVKTRKRGSSKTRISKHKRRKSFRSSSKARRRALLRPPSKRAHRITARVSGSTRGLHPRLRRLISIVKRHYGRSVIISSGCRSYRHNRRVGGARRSMHLRCMAADFKVAGISKGALRRYVSTLPGRGGVGTYCGRSIVHLDVGPRRSWYHGCRKTRRRRG